MDHAEINRLEFRHGRRGEILYRGVGKWRRLPPGTAGQFLKTQGANADPVWDNVPSGGGCGNIRIQVGTYTGTGSGTKQITINDPDCAHLFYVMVVMKDMGGQYPMGGVGFKIDVMSGFGMQFLGESNNSPIHTESEMITFTQPNKFNVSSEFNREQLYHYIAFYRCGLS
jgi:hypothetical protein